MTETEHLLTKVSEECAEIIQAIAKAQRFGLTDIWPERGFSNRHQIESEFLDLLAAMRMLIKRGVLDPDTAEHEIDQRERKILHWMEYARNKGTL